MPQPDTLLIFDYSGTLSLEMPRFARPENLGRALAETGLAALGVTGPEIFWERIVNPTWVEGSTTQRGYKRIIAERIAALGRAPGASPEEITAAASRFVESYLDHSRIAPDWRPLLARLGENPDVGVIVATDHYAEATGRIIAELGAWGIPAVKVGAAPDCETPVLREATVRSAPPCHRPFFIANSADLGAWKVDVAFWETVKAKLRRGEVERLLVVDDFGFNEAAGDTYGGEAAKIAARQERTRETLRKVFQAEAEIVPFFLEKKQTGYEAESARTDRGNGTPYRKLPGTVLRIETRWTQMAVNRESTTPAAGPTR